MDKAIPPRVDNLSLCRNKETFTAEAVKSTAEAQRELMVKDECRKAIHRRGAEKGLLRLVLSNFDVLSAPLR
jgi:hypothetical protein